MLPSVIGGPGGCLGSLDDLVGAGEQRGGTVKAQRLRGLEIDNQRELRRLLYWQVTRLSTMKDFVYKTRALVIEFADSPSNSSSVPQHRQILEHQRLMANDCVQ